MTTSQAFGQKAKRFTLDLAVGKKVEVKTIDTDRYGRTVGIVYVGSRCLNTDLLKNGYAWLYERYCKKPLCSEWKGLERQARINRAGLWVDPDPVAPWDFRHGKKVAKPEVAGSYHGNVKSRKFHRPGCRYYNCKRCTVVFGSRDEAVRAGFEPCKVCGP